MSSQLDNLGLLGSFPHFLFFFRSALPLKKDLAAVITDRTRMVLPRLFDERVDAPRICSLRIVWEAWIAPAVSTSCEYVHLSNCDSESWRKKQMPKYESALWLAQHKIVLFATNVASVGEPDYA